MEFVASAVHQGGVAGDTHTTDASSDSPGQRAAMDSSATPAQLRVLGAFAEAIWPSQQADSGASEAERRFYALAGNHSPAVAEQAYRVINERLMGMNRAMLLLLLHLLSWRLPTLLLVGRHCLSPRFPFLPQALPNMTVDQRQRALLSWRHSWITSLKGAFKALKSILVAVIFALTDERGHGPFFEAVKYPGAAAPPPEPAPSPAALVAEEVMSSAVVDLAAAAAATRGDREALRKLLARRCGGAAAGGGAGGVVVAEEADGTPVVVCDAVVVGSGAGGGVAAGILAQAGLRVVVLEKGSWKKMSDLTLQEGESCDTMFERGAFLTSEDGGISILAGATLGGGTKINWCASLRTPDHVRQEWAREHGLPQFTGPDYDSSLDAVSSRLGVTTTTRLNGNNGALHDGLCEMGADARKLPRNCSSDECSGFCSLGCKTGHKASSDVTYLADAARRGAIIFTGAAARRVLTEQSGDGGVEDGSGEDGDAAAAGVQGGWRRRPKRATGVEVVVGGGEFGGREGGVRVVVRAPIVVASAGSIHSPALLLRSGITCGGNVGANLRLHPAFGVMAVFDRKQQHCAGGDGNIDMFKGVMMLTYSLSAARWEKDGYGAMVSVPSLHPGLLAACHPWDPATFKSRLMELQDIATAVVFARDCGGGRVMVDAQGRPRIHYWPDEDTRKHILEGMELALRAYMAAGARSVTLPHSFGHLTATRDQGPEGLEAMIRQAHAGGVRLYDMPLLSAHQMGSCRMGGSPSDSVCDGRGEVWEVSGLYVADASTFPTASGVNPMITAMAIAHMVSTGIAREAAARRKAALAAAAAAAAASQGEAAAKGAKAAAPTQLVARARAFDDSDEDGSDVIILRDTGRGGK